ncbi:LOW QUALITY PROTEIN: separin-like [Chamaea fasciata]|uniref:LOW QUALITY PROTEIN: separin-like n=1 Tax=Chamaea fasciata TaxID=190680 RepID=UPI003369D0C3
MDGKDEKDDGKDGKDGSTDSWADIEERLEEIRDTLRAPWASQPRRVQACDRALRACVEQLARPGGLPAHGSRLLGLAHEAAQGYLRLVPEPPHLYLEKILFHVVRNAAPWAGSPTWAAAELLRERLRRCRPDGDWAGVARGAFGLLWRAAAALAGPERPREEGRAVLTARIRSLRFLLLLESREDSAPKSFQPPFLTSPTAQNAAAAAALYQAERAPCPLFLARQLQEFLLDALKDETPRPADFRSSLCFLELTLERCRHLCKARRHREALDALRDSREFLGAGNSLGAPLELLEAGIQLGKALAKGRDGAGGVGRALGRAGAALAAEFSGRILLVTAESWRFVVGQLGEVLRRSTELPLGPQELPGLCAFSQGHGRVLRLLLAQVPPDSLREQVMVKQLLFHGLQLFSNAVHEIFQRSQSSEWPELAQVTSSCVQSVTWMVEGLQGLPEAERGKFLDVTAAVTLRLGQALQGRKVPEAAGAVCEPLCRALLDTDGYGCPGVTPERLHRCFRLQVESWRSRGRPRRALDALGQWLLALGTHCQALGTCSQPSQALVALVAEPVALWARIKTEAARQGEEELRLWTLRDAPASRSLGGDALLLLLLAELRAYKSLRGPTGAERYNVLCDLLGLWDPRGAWVFLEQLESLLEKEDPGPGADADLRLLRHERLLLRSHLCCLQRKAEQAVSLLLQALREPRAPRATRGRFLLQAQALRVAAAVLELPPALLPAPLCTWFLVLQSQLEMQQGELELSQSHLQHAQFLLQPQTAPKPRRDPPRPARILLRKGHPATRNPRHLPSDPNPAPGAEEEEEFLQGPSLDLLAPSVLPEQPDALTASPELKPGKRKLLEFLGHPGACPCSFCSDAALVALGLRWLLAQARLWLLAGQGTPGLALLRRVLRRCAGAGTRLQRDVWGRVGGLGPGDGDTGTGGALGDPPGRGDAIENQGGPGEGDTAVGDTFGDPPGVGDTFEDTPGNGDNIKDRDRRVGDTFGDPPGNGDTVRIGDNSGDREILGDRNVLDPSGNRDTIGNGDVPGDRDTPGDRWDPARVRDPSGDGDRDIPGARDTPGDRWDPARVRDPSGDGDRDIPGVRDTPGDLWDPARVRDPSGDGDRDIPGVRDTPGDLWDPARVRDPSGDGDRDIPGVSDLLGDNAPCPPGPLAELVALGYSTLALPSPSQSVPVWAEELERALALLTSRWPPVAGLGVAVATLLLTKALATLGQAAAALGHSVDDVLARCWTPKNPEKTPKSHPERAPRKGRSAETKAAKTPKGKPPKFGEVVSLGDSDNEVPPVVLRPGGVCTPHPKSGPPQKTLLGGPRTPFSIFSEEPSPPGARGRIHRAPKMPGRVKSRIRPFFFLFFVPFFQVTFSDSDPEEPQIPPAPPKTTPKTSCARKVQRPKSPKNSPGIGARPRRGRPRKELGSPKKRGKREKTGINQAENVGKEESGIPQTGLEKRGRRGNPKVGKTGNSQMGKEEKPRNPKVKNVEKVENSEMGNLEKRRKPKVENLEKTGNSQMENVEKPENLEKRRNPKRENPKRENLEEMENLEMENLEKRRNPKMGNPKTENVEKPENLEKRRNPRRENPKTENVEKPENQEKRRNPRRGSSGKKENPPNPREKKENRKETGGARSGILEEKRNWEFNGIEERDPLRAGQEEEEEEEEMSFELPPMPPGGAEEEIPASGDKEDPPQPGGSGPRPQPGVPSLATVRSLLSQALAWIGHCPPGSLYGRLCQLLALTLGDGDPVATAGLLAESLAVTSRHQLLALVHARTRKQRRAAAAAAGGDVSDQLRGLSLQEGDPQNSQNSPNSWDSRLAQLQELFQFSSAGLGPAERERFQEQLQKIPHGVTVCQLSLGGAGPGVLGDALLLTRLERGAEPLSVRVDTRRRQAPLSEILQEFERIQREQREANACTERRLWWERRSQLDQRMQRLIQSLDREVLGCWRALLLPRDPGNSPLEEAELSRLLLELRECGWDSPRPALLQVLLSGLCPADVRPLAAALCPARPLRARFLLAEALERCREGPGGCAGSLVLLLDKHLQRLPWESSGTLRNVPVTRLPALRFLLSYGLTQGSGSVLSRGVDPKNTFYVLNPQRDLGGTEERFRGWFQSEPGWRGVTGAAPTPQQLHEALGERDLYIYAGHGAGARLLEGQSLAQLRCRAVVLLFGCSSAALSPRGDLEPTGTVLKYLLAGCPLVLGTLWDVTDRDLDRLTLALLRGWLGGRPPGPPCCPSWPRPAAAPRLRALIGAAPVAYGLPVCLGGGGSWGVPSVPE